MSATKLEIGQTWRASRAGTIKWRHILSVRGKSVNYYSYAGQGIHCDRVKNFMDWIARTGATPQGRAVPEKEPK